MVLLSSKKLPADFKAKNFELLGIDDKKYSLESFADKKFLLVVFMCVHCPYVQAIENQLIEIKDKFADDSFEIVGINPNDPIKYVADNLDGMKRRAKEKGYNFVYLQDETQEVAKAYEAVCTPDIYLFNENRDLVYHGRVDEVESCLSNLIENKKWDEQVVPSQGCSIKWKED